MAGTNVPLPTFGATGYVVPSSQAVLAGVIADMQGAFGGALNLSATNAATLTTPQGQLAQSWAAIISNVYQEFAYYTQQVDPAYAIGRMQDAIGRIYFLIRNGAQPTTLQILCSGAGITIPAGATIQDNVNNIYVATGPITLPPGGGSATGSFACTVPGPVAVPTSGNVSIYQSQLGWDSVSATSGTIGTNTESRQSFEARRQQSVAGNSFGAIGSIIGAVAAVPGVTDFFGFDNSTNGTVTVGTVSIAANSVYICVAGGAQAAVALAIWSKKPPGCGYVGNTTVIVTDPNPLFSPPAPTYTVKYQIPTTLQLLFSVTLVNSSSLPSNAAQQVQTALINAVTQGVIATNPQVVSGLRARIGAVVYAVSYIQAINALGPWAQVAAISIGSANTPTSTFTASISGLNMTVTAVSANTLAAGQVLADATNALAPGTTIISQTSGPGGGTGVYVVSISQAVGSEAMTGSTANQTLVSVQANQEPALIVTDILVGHT